MEDKEFTVPGGVVFPAVRFKAEEESAGLAVTVHVIADDGAPIGEVYIEWYDGRLVVHGYVPAVSGGLEDEPSESFCLYQAPRPNARVSSRRGRRKDSEAVLAGLRLTAKPKKAK